MYIIPVLAQFDLHLILTHCNAYV